VALLVFSLVVNVLALTPPIRGLAGQAVVEWPPQENASADAGQA
jgi:hypothetical protein